LGFLNDVPRIQEASQPSKVFRDWARRFLSDPAALAPLAEIRSQAEYDDWHRRWCDGLGRYWAHEAGKPLPWGPSRKMPNLLMKGMLLDWRSEAWDNRAALRIAKWAHVPLDKYTLAAIQGEVADRDAKGKLRRVIPSRATMGWVADQMIYSRIQRAIRDVCHEAGIYPIQFDAFYDIAH
jgi:hypothetical protein